jgi:hypothetical protein
MKDAYQERVRQGFEDDICAYLEMEQGGTLLLDDLVEILEDWHSYYAGHADEIKKVLSRLGINRYD